MRRQRDPTMSANELDVLGVLWQRGPATLGEVSDALAGRHAYTTVQTMLDRLVKKGLVSRDRRARPARHAAKVTRARVLSRYLGLVLERVTDGPAPLVMQLLREQQFTPDELVEIRRLIERAEHDQAESEQE